MKMTCARAVEMESTVTQKYLILVARAFNLLRYVYFSAGKKSSLQIFR